MSYISRVETPARLHFGFTSLSRSGGRLYGGLGAAVDRPRAVVEAEPASSPRVEVAGDVVDRDLQRRRVKGYLEDALDHLDVPGAHVRLVSGIPVHAGLGSGTQTALAVAEAVSLAHSIEFEPLEAAAALGRGSRSGVGVGVYRSGGFVLDSGVAPNSDEKVPRVAARHVLPSDWRFVLVPSGGTGVHGDLEDELLDDVLSSPSGVESEATDALVTQVLPGAAEADMETFGAGVARVGAVNGDLYRDAGVQDDRYGRPEVVSALAESDGVHGAGQSSWGPTVYGLTSVDRSEEVAAEFDDAYVVEPDGGGAASRVTPR